MPGTVIANPTPAWLKPENSSVLDPLFVRFVRALVNANPLPKALEGILPNPNPASMVMDPQAQALALMMPMDATGGGIKAFHGSPHDFDRFSTAKIGTGEGVQAYGHGLYFAENPKTARAYREALSDGSGEMRTLAGAAYDQANASHAAGVRILEDGSPEKAIRRLNAEIAQSKEFGDEANAAFLRDVQRKIWRNQSEPMRIQDPGRMYEVSINADPEQLLDWDKPLNQQSEHVQGAIAKMREAGVVHDGFGMTRPENTGGNFVKSKGVVAPEHNLRRFGVPGIKYLDGGSRASGDGSRNFVIFDDSLVSILKKYGVALPVIEGLRRKAAANGGSLPEDDVRGVM